MKIIIDEKEFEVKEGQTVLEAAREKIVFIDNLRKKLEYTKTPPKAGTFRGVFYMNYDRRVAF